MLTIKLVPLILSIGDSKYFRSKMKNIEYGNSLY